MILLDLIVECGSIILWIFLIIYLDKNYDFMSSDFGVVWFTLSLVIECTVVLSYKFKIRPILKNKIKSKKQTTLPPLQNARTMEIKNKNIFCRECGAKNDYDAIFCSSCGRKIEI